MKSFQTLFPPLAPQDLSLSSARRIVLVTYNPDRDTIDFRHYLITVKPYGVSRRVRKVLEGSTSTKTSTPSGLLDLGREQDIADFLLRKKGESGPDGDGYESAASSASSAAEDDGDAISLAEDYVGRNNKRGQKRAVRLDEIGPRMELRLIKITEGVPGKEGAVMYHSFGVFLSFSAVVLVSDRVSTVVKKTKTEVKELKKVHAEKAQLKKQRREEQERNVARKKQKPDANGQEGDGGEAESGEEDVGEEEEEGAWDEEEEVSEGEESEVEDNDSDSEAEETPQPARKRGKR